MNTKDFSTSLRIAKDWANSGNGGRPDRMMDGMSANITRKLSNMSPNELQDLRDNNKRMLSNPSLLSTLPDGGAKLKETVERIDAILGPLPVTGSNYTDGGLEEQDNVERRLMNIHLNEQKINVRQQAVDMVNSKAAAMSDSTPGNMLRKGSINSASTNESLVDKNGHHAKVQLMSLEEAMELEASQQSQAREAYMMRSMQPSQKAYPSAGASLADDLSVTMESMKLDPETRPGRPQDDDPSEDESEDDSEMGSRHSSDGAYNEASDDEDDENDDDGDDDDFDEL
ncbi:hypothetical protein J3Q64DRAFT_1698343 [Phycomyces blakesleeanus]|uniref:Uncharacterized protein n=2 Tax=Phycomyces blakesleeanus TaxID=4837 RepID=A0ABR3B0U0_PHYBL